MASQLEIEVGVPHVKSRINDIRNSSYNINIAFLDIMDNVAKGCQTKILYNHKDDDIKNIIIMDDDKEGFKNILNKGINNPLNMGHKNENRHKDDNSNSEYGIGLKSGGAFLGDKLTIYTRIKNDCYVKAILDFNKMCEEEEPIKSYEPTIYLIEKHEYKKNHLFEYGSTIIIDKLRHKLKHSIFGEIFKHQIKNTYNYQIKKYNKKIQYEDIDIRPNKLLEESPLCKKRMRTTTIYFDETFEKMYGVVFINGIFNTSYIRSDKKDDVVKDKNNYTGYESNKITIRTTSIYGSVFDENTRDRENIEEYEYPDDEYTETFKNHEGEYILPKTSCFIYRDNRCFGTYPFTNLKKSNDGYHNYTIHQIFYENKKYNLYFGVNSSKGNLVRRDCVLIKFIEDILKKIQNDLSTKKILESMKPKGEKPKKEEPKGTIVKRYKKGPLSDEEINQIVKQILNNKEEYKNNSHLKTLFNETFM